jgi:hypothetical protein
VLASTSIRQEAFLALKIGVFNTRKYPLLKLVLSKTAKISRPEMKLSIPFSAHPVCEPPHSQFITEHVQYTRRRSCSRRQQTTRTLAVMLLYLLPPNHPRCTPTHETRTNKCMAQRIKGLRSMHTRSKSFVRCWRSQGRLCHRGWRCVALIGSGNNDAVWLIVLHVVSDGVSFVTSQLDRFSRRKHNWQRD